MRLLGALIVAFLAGQVAAFELSLPPGARAIAERSTKADSYAAPLGGFAEGRVPTVRLEGAVQRQVWRMTSPGLTTLQVLEPLRSQVQAAGYEVVLDCDQRSCGGFDFRFGVEVLPAPNMYVNLRAYRFLTALRGPAEAPEAVVTLLVSTTPAAAFVQFVTVEAEGLPENAKAPSVTSVRSFGQELLAQGRAVLQGVEFETGLTTLGPGPFPSLKVLAAFLKERPGVTVALVGHTDSVGALEGNIALSRARARAVRNRLVETYGIEAARLEAEGMGYLAPIASNLEEAGREANRRVEVVLLSEK